MATARFTGSGAGGATVVRCEPLKLKPLLHLLAPLHRPVVMGKCYREPLRKLTQLCLQAGLQQQGRGKEEREHERTMERKGRERGRSEGEAGAHVGEGDWREASLRVSLVHTGRAGKYQDVGRRSDSGVASEAKRELALPEGKGQQAPPMPPAPPPTAPNSSLPSCPGC